MNFVYSGQAQPGPGQNGIRGFDQGIFLLICGSWKFFRNKSYSGLKTLFAEGGEEKRGYGEWD